MAFVLGSVELYDLGVIQRVQGGNITEPAIYLDWISGFFEREIGKLLLGFFSISCGVVCGVVSLSTC